MVWYGIDLYSTLSHKSLMRVVRGISPVREKQSLVGTGNDLSKSQVLSGK